MNCKLLKQVNVIDVNRLTILLSYNLFQFKWFVNDMFIQLLNSATFPMWTSLLKIGVRYISPWDIIQVIYVQIIKK